MPRFYFNLKARQRTIVDSEGTELRDETAADAEAVVIAREIMRNNHSDTRTWRLLVCDAEHQPCFELLFATVDEELQYYPESVRQTVTAAAQRVATLEDDIGALRQTLLQVRATLARADKMPYLATVDGTRVDS